MWATLDPFLLCVFHQDYYPPGNTKLGPNARLDGRNIGMDFEGADGWRMYHGDVVPGFPKHPHRGFETITIVREGYVDHSDSLGAAARYGQGDVQWMTAGRGIVHSEMFPLLNQEQPNTLDLFQIWLNLPSNNKLCEPHICMLWADTIPKLSVEDVLGLKSQVTVIAGEFMNAKAPAPPPNSWAAEHKNNVGIFLVSMEPHAELKLPVCDALTHRNLYYFKGQSITLNDQDLEVESVTCLRADVEVKIKNAEEASEFLILQSKPIGEKVSQYGPFVMNTEMEIQQAFVDYQTSGFGGWSWDSSGPVHGFEKNRFFKEK